MESNVCSLETGGGLLYFPHLMLSCDFEAGQLSGLFGAFRILIQPSLRNDHKGNSILVFKNQQIKWKQISISLLCFQQSNRCFARSRAECTHWSSPRLTLLTRGHPEKARGTWPRSPAAREEQERVAVAVFLVHWSAGRWLTVLAFKWS